MSGYYSFKSNRVNEYDQYKLMLQTGSLNAGKGSGKEHDIAVNSEGLSPNATGTGEFKRKLSKREKKELKKQEKLNKVKNKENSNKGIGAQNEEGVAEKLYTGKHFYIELYI